MTVAIIWITERLIPIFDELNDISYLKKYYSCFDPAMKNFVKEDVMYEDTLNRNI